MSVMQRSQQNISQVGSLVLQRHREETLFSELPQDLIQEMMNYGQAINEDAAKLLRHAAYARQEDVDAIIAMLDANPRLLFDTSDVITPGGLDVRCVTVYEFALGAGDPELAELIGKYFAILGAEGEAEKARQYERYKLHIEGMLTQLPYDLTPLIEIIKQASADDVTALLNKNMKRESVLRDAIIQFRKDFAPGVLKKPGMHYNYRSLQHAFEMLDREWENLYRASGNNFDMICLVWRQLIGFEMRRLPGVDRCVLAQGLHYLYGVEKPEKFARSYKFKNNHGDFPITPVDDSLDGLGGDIAVDIIGRWHGGGLEARGGGRIWASWSFLENLCRAKTSNLQNLCSHAERKRADV